MSLTNSCSPHKKRGGCKHTRRIIRGYITVEIRQFNSSSEPNRYQSSLRSKCIQCEEEEKEATREKQKYSYYKNLKITQSKIHTPLTYQELQSNLAMILPSSFGLAVVEKEGSQILPGESFPIQDGDTIIVREIRPPLECDKVYKKIEWKYVDYEKAL